MRGVLSLLVVGAALVLPVPAAGQRAVPAAVTASRDGVARQAAVSVAAPLASVDAPSRFGTRRIVQVAGGAALGSALGYFASQIRMSNWDARANSAEGHAMRRRYVISGAAAGAVLGFVIPGGSRGPLPARRPPRDVLLPKDFVTTGASNAYDAVRTLRPNWLAVREVLSLGQAVGGAAAAAGGTEATGDFEILVYLDRAKLGGVQSLRDIDLSIVRYIQFFNGTEATYRWGWGHAHGVVFVSTMDP